MKNCIYTCLAGLAINSIALYACAYTTQTYYPCDTPEFKEWLQREIEKSPDKKQLSTAYQLSQYQLSQEQAKIINTLYTRIQNNYEDLPYIIEDTCPEHIPWQTLPDWTRKIFKPYVNVMTAGGNGYSSQKSPATIPELRFKKAIKDHAHNIFNLESEQTKRTKDRSKKINAFMTLFFKPAKRVSIIGLGGIVLSKLLDTIGSHIPYVCAASVALATLGVGAAASSLLLSSPMTKFKRWYDWRAIQCTINEKQQELRKAYNDLEELDANVAATCIEELSNDNAILPIKGFIETLRKTARSNLAKKSPCIEMINTET